MKVIGSYSTDLKYLDRQVWANSVGTGAFRSGSTLFVILSAYFWHITVWYNNIVQILDNYNCLRCPSCSEFCAIPSFQSITSTVSSVVELILWDLGSLVFRLTFQSHIKMLVAAPRLALREN